MAVRIRLRRMGRKKRPFYRIIATDQRSPRDGRFIETLGYYNPLTKPHTLEVNQDKVMYWLNNGAQPSDTVKSLLSQNGIMLRLSLMKQGKDEEFINKELEKWEQQQVVKSEKKAQKLEAREQAKKEKETKQQAEVVEEANEDSHDDAPVTEETEAPVETVKDSEEQAEVVVDAEENAEKAEDNAEEAKTEAVEEIKDEEKDDKEDKKETEKGSAE